MVYDFGLRLKWLREKKGLTQKHLGKLVNISEKSISGYENNLSEPKLAVLKDLALLFNVTTDFLLGIENRKVIILNVKSKAQEQLLEEMVNKLQVEFNKEKGEA